MGQITAQLQRGNQGLDHLKSPERGFFDIQRPKSPNTRFDHLIEVLRATAEAGFIRIISTEDTSVRFRLHRSLAAHFGFSYRGPQYPIRVDWTDIDRIVQSNSMPNLKREIAILLEKSGAASSQLGLFDNG